MDYYNYSVDLPYTKTKIYFREINTQEQLYITKANLSFPNDRDNLFDYSQYILNVLLNCVKNKEDFDQINIIEYVLFLVKLRITSIGSTIEFLLKDEDSKKSKTKIQINLKNYLLNLYKASNYFESDNESILKENDLQIKLNWPNIKSIKTFNDIALSDKKDYEIFNETIYEFLEYIKIGDKKIIWHKLKNAEKVALFDKLPLILKNKIQEKIISALKKLVESDLFQISLFGDNKFNIYNLNFVEHIKIIFSYDLKSLYSEVYYLAVNNLPPDYIMTISNSERKLYMTIIEENAKKQDKDSDNLPEPQAESGYATSDPVKKLALEFGQVPSK
jgi:hypothetical protein